MTCWNYFIHQRVFTVTSLQCELYSNEAENKQGNEKIWDAMTTLCENLIYEVLEVVIYDVRTLSNINCKIDTHPAKVCMKRNFYYRLFVRFQNKNLKAHVENNAYCSITCNA